VGVKTNEECEIRTAEMLPSRAPGFAERAASSSLELDTPHSALRASHSIVLHIDELVLYGFSPADRHRIAEGVERELGRLIAQEGLTAPFASNVHLDEFDGGSIPLARASRAAATGSKIAGAVFSAARSAVVPTESPAAGLRSSSAGGVLQ
jgi:hypothetical protein